MDSKPLLSFLLFKILLISLSDALRLNHRRPATVWGVQKPFFWTNSEKDYFRSLDGTYHFKYDTGFGHQQMFRGEKRHMDGSVTGFFGYIDPDGILRITEYVAGRFGYQQRTVLRYPVMSND